MGEERGRQVGMPLAEFTDETWKGLASGTDQIVVGSLLGIMPPTGSPDPLRQVIDTRRAMFGKLAKKMRGE